MVPLIIGSALLHTIVLASPEKTAVIGPHVAEARKKAIRYARSVLNNVQKATSIPEDKIGPLREDIRLLQRTAAAGWSSIDEVMALGRVSAMVVEKHAKDATSGVHRKANELVDAIFRGSDDHPDGH